MRKIGTVFILLLLICNTAFANNLEQAEQLYHIGKYSDSAQLARTIKTADAFSLAAKATLVEGTFIAPEKDKFSLFQQTIEDAKAALTLDSKHIEAHLQIALALGSIADLRHPIIAYLKGYATEGKQHLDTAYSLAPNDAWVNGLLGIWHLQVVNRASALLADNIYDANIKDGLHHCNKAKLMDGVDLQILYGCAISLYEFDEEPYTKQASHILRLVVERPSFDATESFIIKLAKNRLNVELLRN